MKVNYEDWGLLFQLQEQMKEMRGIKYLNERKRTKRLVWGSLILCVIFTITAWKTTIVGYGIYDVIFPLLALLSGFMFFITCAIQRSEKKKEKSLRSSFKKRILKRIEEHQELSIIPQELKEDFAQQIVDGKFPIAGKDSIYRFIKYWTIDGDSLIIILNNGEKVEC